MFQHIVDQLTVRGFRVIDYEDAYTTASAAAGLSADIATFRTRRPQCFIFALGNFVEVAGQAFVFWDLTVDDSPLQPSPYVNFQNQLNDPKFMVGTPMPIEVSQNRKVALRARNSGAAAYQCTARIMAFYCEVVLDPVRADAPPPSDKLPEHDKDRPEAQRFGAVVG